MFKGQKHTEATKLILSQQKRRNKHPSFHKGPSEETRKKISESVKRYIMEKNKADLKLRNETN